MGGAIGYIIGAVIFLPLILLGINYYFINKNDAEKYIKNYMDDYSELIIKTPDAFSKENILNSKLYEFETYTTSLATKNMGRDGSSKVDKNYKTIFDYTLNKYFQITMFNVYGDFWGCINNNLLTIRVNKQDLNNPNLGTKEKPILVFSVKGAQSPLMMKNVKGILKNYDVSQKQYEFNVYMFLTYAMSKEEFKERFEKGK
ncbi:hypothetical protein [Pedobacter cryoconitis]|uniref:DUF8188 domain-containing protein n=1 Tax=Pedobacter cryoconitis TaxID=188932 RepID=A0A327RW03_9SPHI|nr:hypothetical protein [Pedobacter cryoconitis]RAJ20899.1 hypothetical protein LY11_05101 [Pedobacter cryoconitis]